MAKVTSINEIPIKDAKKSVVLHITKNDVNKGRSKKPGECAAALACKRDFGATEARVHMSRVYLRFNGHWERYKTSGALRSEIVAFDRGGRFEPGEYILLKMEPSRKGDKSRGQRNGRGRKPRGPIHILTNVRPASASLSH